MHQSSVMIMIEYLYQVFLFFLKSDKTIMRSKARGPNLIQDCLGTEVWRDRIYKVISADRTEQNSNRYIENI